MTFFHHSWMVYEQLLVAWNFQNLFQCSAATPPYLMLTRLRKPVLNVLQGNKAWMLLFWMFSFWSQSGLELHSANSSGFRTKQDLVTEAMRLQKSVLCKEKSLGKKILVRFIHKSVGQSQQAAIWHCVGEESLPLIQTLESLGEGLASAPVIPWVTYLFSVFKRISAINYRKARRCIGHNTDNERNNCVPLFTVPSQDLCTVLGPATT